MIKVQFYSLIRLLLNTEGVQVEWSEGDTVQRVLQNAQRNIPTPFLHKLVDEQGAMYPGTIILVNRNNIRHLDMLQSRVQDGDVVALFPPGAGG